MLVTLCTKEFTSSFPRFYRMTISTASTPPNKAQRQALAEETRRLTPQIIRSADASTQVIYYPTQLPRRDPIPNARGPRITVQNSDSFTAARAILDTNPTAKIGVLNMASEKHPGGGWLRGALAQEEALCFRSTLAATLHKRFYPLPVLGAVWSPNVVVFRDEVATDARIYEPAEMFTVGVVSLAAMRRPLLTPDKRNFARPQDIRTVRDKMRQTLRVLAVNNVTHCVLGAMGCGAFQNPPLQVALLFRDVLEEEEFMGVFEEITFAVLDSRGEGNYAIFRDTLQSRS
ncbi:hypothetical protein N7519_004111 [Penicillium mononematosum]|uniref:uncharacterized protein n=1 Tax=Penicillium mononematosum TaxID=268346 RepID=UPI00254660A3|nr:uncharacterized protein N7519_004111 [Penicillium mononematosum]KAJ6189203.1 hypothetical protein N7519_004111 [Penicillium mononematosum]